MLVENNQRAASASVVSSGGVTLAREAFVACEKAIYIHLARADPARAGTQSGTSYHGSYADGIKEAVLDVLRKDPLFS